MRAEYTVADGDQVYLSELHRTFDWRLQGLFPYMDYTCAVGNQTISGPVVASLLAVEVIRVLERICKDLQPYFLVSCGVVPEYALLSYSRSCAVSEILNKYHLLQSEDDSCSF